MSNDAKKYIPGLGTDFKIQAEDVEGIQTGGADVSKEYVDGEVSKKQDKGDYLTKTAADGYYQPKGSFLTQTDADARYVQTSAYNTKITELDNRIKTLEAK